MGRTMVEHTKRCHGELCRGSGVEVVFFLTSGEEGVLDGRQNRFRRGEMINGQWVTRG